MPVAEALLTAEEYSRLPDNGQPTELVPGRVVELNLPAPRHGQICAEVARLLGNFAQDHQLGHVVCNNSGVITERDPDTVRGPDVAFYGYDQFPPGPLPQGYLPVVPHLAFEVRSPGDRWAKLLLKVGEYLSAGVAVVCIFDQQTETAHVYRPEQAPQFLTAREQLTFPDVLPGFTVEVARFFQ